MHQNYYTCRVNFGLTCMSNREDILTEKSFFYLYNNKQLPILTTQDWNQQWDMIWDIKWWIFFWIKLWTFDRYKWEQEYWKLSSKDAAFNLQLEQIVLGCIKI